jgi:hypothetical protein
MYYGYRCAWDTHKTVIFCKLILLAIYKFVFLLQGLFLERCVTLEQFKYFSHYFEYCSNVKNTMVYMSNSHFFMKYLN